MKLQKLEGVEAARGMAALLVVLVHATGMLAGAKYLGVMALDGIFKFGHAGVDFFFVLSGFIIYFIHANELGQRQFFSDYWLKRFVRIVPLYWVVLSVYGVLLMVSPTKELYERIPSVVLSSVFLLPHELGPILGVAWTLSHELLFYALFGVLFLHKKLGIAILCLWLFGIVFNMVFNFASGFFWGELVFRIFNVGFFFGILVGYLIKLDWIKFPGAIGLLGGIVFFGAGIYESWGPGTPIEWAPLHLAYAVGAAMALYGLVGLEKQGRLKVPQVMVVLGKASYSIYLVHVIVIMVLQQVFLLIKPYIGLPNDLIFLVFVFVTVCVAVVFSRWVEEPLLKYCRHHILR